MGRNKDGENRMIQTNTIGLKKPEKNEFIDISVLNENFDRIDQCFSLMEKSIVDKFLRKPIQGSLIIPVVGWIDELNGEYTKKIVVSLADAQPDKVATIMIDFASEEVAKDCGLASINETGSNSITFYAQKIPTKSIRCHYYLL